MNACLRRNSGMEPLRPRAAACVAALLVLAACAAPAPRGGPAQDSQPASAQNGVVTDASYDWRGLVLAPFGTLLKESPIPLHEVVLFRDETHGTADADGKDCYGIDGAPPRFAGRQPDEYLLCFDHDRLTRVDVSVRVASEEAAQVFAQACALWLKESAPLQAMSDICEGRDGRITFNARLSGVPGEPTESLSMTLSEPGAGGSAADAPGAAPREK